MNKLDIMILEEILTKGNKILNMSIYEFAEESNVSASKITKTCKKLGFTGYKQLRYTVQSTEYISSSNAFIILLKIDKIKKELIQLTNKEVDYELLDDKYKEFHELLCDSNEGEVSELMIQVRKTLINILNYYTCLSSFEDKPYYLNFMELIINELKTCFQ